MRVVTGREWITNKTATCNCGCNGQDPRHRRQYRRKVKRTSETTGTVTMPYSSQPVQVVRDVQLITDSGRTVYGTWTVVRDSIVFDKKG